MLRFTSFCYPISWLVKLHGLNNVVVYQLINKLLKFSYLLVKNDLLIVDADSAVALKIKFLSGLDASQSLKISRHLLIDADSAVALNIKFLSGLDVSQSLKISRRLRPSFLHTEL